MPDLVSHVASVYVLRNFFPKFRICRTPYIWMTIFGVFLPDVIARGVILVLPKSFLTAQFFHTPFGCFFQTLLISCFFVKEQRVGVFGAITAGWILHQTFDLAEVTLSPSYYYVFWPLYNQSISVNLILPEHWPYIAAATLLIALLSGRKAVAWMYRNVVSNIRVAREK